MDKAGPSLAVLIADRVGKGKPWKNKKPASSEKAEGKTPEEDAGEEEEATGDDKATKYAADLRAALEGDSDEAIVEAIRGIVGG